VNLAFQLRHLFGPGSRSEVMRVLLTYSAGSLDAARISDEAGFSKRNASDALTELAASGVIKATWSGNERHFAASRDRWAALLNLGSADNLPAFVPWVHVLPAALEIITWLDSEARTADSEYLVASRAHSLIDRIARDLEMAGVEVPQRRSAPGAAYLPAVADATESLLTQLRTGQ
jgi:DNA-binding transcriptional regulator GbsR (MarR family)